MSTDDPRRAMSAGTPAPEAFRAAADEAIEQLAVAARVPAWVLNPEKWQSMTRAERRAAQRYHERETRRRRR